MAKLGCYSTFPIRFGGSIPQTKIIHDSLNASRGTALDTTPTSPVWAETLGPARAIGGIWHANEAIGNARTPLKLNATLARREKILNIPVDPNATPTSRRANVNSLVSRTGVMPSHQEIIDRLTVALAPVTFTIVHGVPGAAGTISSWAGGWYVQSRGTTPPVVGLMTPPPAVPTSYSVIMQVITGGSLGTATFIWSSNGGLTYSGVTTTAASVTLGSTGLVASFPVGTYNADNQYVAATATIGFSTSVANIVVAATLPAGMLLPDFIEKAKAIPPLLDAFLPAWVGFSVVLDGSTPGAFILDDAHNLDFERLA